MLESNPHDEYYYRNGAGWGFFYRNVNGYLEMFSNRRWVRLDALFAYDVSKDFYGPFESLEIMYEALFAANADPTCIENFERNFL